MDRRYEAIHNGGFTSRHDQVRSSFSELQAQGLVVDCSIGKAGERTTAHIINQNGDALTLPVTIIHQRRGGAIQTILLPSPSQMARLRREVTLG